MHPLLGYFDRWSVKAGETITLMVGSTGDAPFETRISRILCADPNPRGPGYKDVPAPHPLDGWHAGKEQRTHLGSCAQVPRLDLGGARSGLVIVATIWPTTPDKGRQCVFAFADDDGSRLSLEIDRDGVAAAVMASGKTTRIATNRVLLPREWYDIWLALDGDSGQLAVGQRPRQPHPMFDDSGAVAAALAELPGPSIGRAVIAASPAAAGTDWPEAHFNGKIERPTLWAGKDIEAAFAARRSGEVARPEVVACWDFSVGISSLQVVDIGPGAFHGTLANMPARAMTGSNWSGREHNWTRTPQEWGAIHFHEDDLGDVGWEPSLRIEIPKDWQSGLYAIHMRSASGVDNVPFVVRPADGARLSKVALLLPTVSYQIYGQYVRPGYQAQNMERSLAWGAITHTPDGNPELGLSTYNLHSDGSGVSIASMARPMIDKRVNQFILLDPVEYGSGTYWICADSYIIDWLSRAGIEHDVITDHDLHAEGAGLLKQYTAVLTGEHPEYHTSEMLDGLEGYLKDGGRLIYLGGNGFYWKTVFHPEAPWALELRRAEGGVRAWATEVGESYHAFDGSYGGLWRRIGRPAHRLVGNGFSCQGIYLGYPYTVAEGMLDPRVAFVRAGIEDQLLPGAQFGERGFMGGGAVGHELDRADRRLGTPAHAIVVASGVVDHPEFKPVNEDRLTHYWPGTREEITRSDITFFETPAGGAVFSVGSMCFVGALPVDNYACVLTRMMTNVVRRFADPAPFDPGR